MGTFITRLTLFAPVGPIPLPGDGNGSARQVPTTNWYANFNERPLNVGGKLIGRGRLYVSVGAKKKKVITATIIENQILTSTRLSWLET